MHASIRQVLVHLDATRSVANRLAIAREIAETHDAAVTGLYATLPAYASLPYGPGLGPGLAAELARLDDCRWARVQQLFHDTFRDTARAARWARLPHLHVAEAFAQQGRYSDLMLLGQHDPADEAAGGLPPDFVPSVLAACGRPALVIPRIGWPGQIGSTVAIAWKETPEAARAVSAALPFLQRARQVHVMSWGAEKEEDASVPTVHRLDLASWLSAHGVQAHMHRGGPAPRALGELVLSSAFDVDADLLVMGCYGHSRAREWILGGVSRTLLDSMTLPVLMSH